jgi:hypothetical protein
MNPGLVWFLAIVATFVAPAWSSAASPLSQAKMASVQYLVGTWSCAHTVGTFSGTYTTAYANALGDLWLRQTYEFPPSQNEKAEPAVHAEYFMGYDERRQAWVRFGVMSTGQYFAIRMTETGDTGWSWNYVSFFMTQRPESPGSDATFTKKSNSEYAVDGPSYMQDGTPVTEHHICKKVGA